MRPTTEIFAAAIAELEQLSADPLSLDQAISFPDALMLAVLTSRPLQVKSFSALELGRHLVGPKSGWLVTVPGAETKTRQPIDCELPASLLPWFERYLSLAQPLLPHAAQSSRL